MAIQTKVDDCPDIEANVRKFLVDRAASSHQTFLPFSVERVHKTDRMDITSYRTMYKLAAHSLNKPQPHFLQPIRTASKKTSSLSSHYDSSNKQHLLDGALLQTFYAEEMSLEKMSLEKNRKPWRRVIPVARRKPQDRVFFQQPKTKQDREQDLLQKDVPVSLPVRENSKGHRKMKPSFRGLF